MECIGGGWGEEGWREVRERSRKERILMGGRAGQGRSRKDWLEGREVSWEEKVSWGEEREGKEGSRGEKRGVSSEEE